MVEQRHQAIAAAFREAPDGPAHPSQAPSWSTRKPVPFRRLWLVADARHGYVFA
jgi:hypothetical protein